MKFLRNPSIGQKLGQIRKWLHSDHLMYCDVQVKVKIGKGKCIYIALISVVHARRSGMDHTVLPAIAPIPAFTS